jgi:hypothetical protein
VVAERDGGGCAGFSSVLHDTCPQLFGGRTGRDIAFEYLPHQGIDSIDVADDKRTALCMVTMGGQKVVILLRWAAFEGKIYLSPEKAPDPKTGVFKPWILKRNLR